MRIDLNCPYRDKDKAKAQGAKWDPDRKTWYVIDPPDLKPFSKWMKDGGKVTEFFAGPSRKPQSQPKHHRPKQRGRQNRREGCATIGRQYFDDTAEYHVPPWEDVDDWQAIKALREACA